MSSELDSIMAALAKLGKGFDEVVASKVEKTLQMSLVRTLSAGETPDGQAWAERKIGGRAYANAAKRVSTKALGNLVKVTLTGPEVYAQHGAGVPRRQMIPDAGAGIPKTVETALRDAALEAFNEAVK